LGVGRVEGQCEIADPLPQTDCYGNTVNFSTEVTGNFGSISSYRWESRSPSGSWTTISDLTNIIQGSSTSTLTIHEIGVNNLNRDGTEYRVIAVTTNCGPLTTNPAVLHINSINSIDPDDQNPNICQGEDYDLTVSATGAVISYQWKFNDGSGLVSLTNNGTYSGTNTSHLTIANATPAQTGDYRVTISFQTINQDGHPTDTCIRTSTLTRHLTVSPSPTISGPSVVCQNSTHVYSTESGMTNYVWNYTGGTLISGGGTTDNTIEIQWTNTGNQSVSVNYTDLDGCTALQPTQLGIIVNNLPSFSSALVTDPIDCFGGTATVTIVATGGTTPYSYTFNGLTNSTGVFSGVTAGTNLTYSITDVNDCGPVTGNINVTQPPVLALSSALVTDPIDCFGGTATVTIVATGGTTPYSYTFNGLTNSTGVFSGVTAGTNLAYSITDVNDCGPVTGNINVTQPPVLALSSALVTDPIDCFGGTATVTIVATGGTTPYSYTFNGLTNSTGVFSGVTAGTNLAYSITDVNDCGPVTGNINVTQPPVLALSSALVTDPIDCFGGTATVTIVATGGTTPYSYTFNGLTNSTGVFSGVTAGTNLAYSITDVNDCGPVTGNINVTQPPVLALSSALVTDPIDCFGGTATVTIVATGGTTPYSYTFNGLTNSTGVFSGVTAGTNLAYSITDVNDCGPVTGNINVTQPPVLALSSALVTDPIDCFGGTATVTIVATGGTTPYSYTFNGLTNSTGVFSGVTAGTNLAYSITDVNDCGPVTGNINVTQPPVLALSSALVTDPIDCFGGTATVTIVATGGTTPYSYTFNGLTNSTGVFSGVTAGTNLAYSITDVNDCGPVTGNINVTQPPVLALSSALVTDPIDCFGGTATVTIVATGGTTPYSYTFNGLTNSTGVFSGVTAGTNLAYSITDVNDCGPVTGNINVTQPPVLALSSALVTDPIDCFGGTATVTIVATGGTTPYSYTFNGLTNSTGVFSGVTAGTNLAYSITDVNDCGPVTGNINVTQPPVLALSSALVTDPIDCFGGTATVTIVATGGTTPYSYTFNGLTNSTGVFSGVTAGTNLAYSITDVNDCGPVTGNINVTQPPVLALSSALVTDPIDCFGGTATVTIVATGGTTPYSYTFNGLTNSTGVFAGVSAGTNLAYSITDVNDCGPVTW
jgi:hypothetical protein